ncbi:ommochrome-binding protein-like [Cydia splendana]|uniref:ommochrome-binding protein-like n=1 Tax=Cydia splendana TaxID=1100963 RepID=UPI00300C7222
MKIIFLLSILTSSIIAKTSKCHSCFMGVCYQRTKIFGGTEATSTGDTYQITGQLAVDRNKEKNILYFHYVKNNIDYTGAYDLNNDMAYTIANISFSFARAVAPNGDVYMSGPKGIYKYNAAANTTVLHGLKDSTIWHMQYKDKLYYNIHSEPGLNVLEKKASPILSLKTFMIEDFVIDKYGDIYFLANMTIHRLKHDSKEVEDLVDQIYILTTDRNGNVYFAHTATSGIYKIDYSIDRIVSVGAFGGNGGTPLKFVFDNLNNVVYLDEDQALYFLRPTYRGCKVSSNVTGKRRMLSVYATDVWVAS